MSRRRKIYEKDTRTAPSPPNNHIRPDPPRTRRAKKRTVNLPEPLFNQVIAELENFRGYVWERWSEIYAQKLRDFIDELETYQSLESTTKEEKTNG